MKGEIMKKRVFSLFLSAIIALSLLPASYAAEKFNVPASFSVSTESDNPMLKWAKVQGAVEYAVYRLNSDTGKYKEIGKTSALSYTDTKVKSSSARQYYVRAIDKKGKLSNKSSIKNTIAKASNIEKSDITNTSVTLSWQASKNAKKYVIEQRIGNGEYEAIKTTSKTTFTIKQLKSDTSYKFRIRPKSNIGKKTVYGERSAAVSVKTPALKGKLNIDFIDVGQGDSIFISLPNGKNALIDTGEGDETVRFLKSKGVKTIDYLIATHPHADHIGGMAAVINTFNVKSMYMTNAVHTTKTFENLLDAIEQKGLSINTVSAGLSLFDFGNVKAEFIAPNSESYSNLNNYSAVLLLSYNNNRFLFMGDAEREEEAKILSKSYDISADVIKIGHHGSSSSSSLAFINAVKPKYAVISCGAENLYGHPDLVTLAILSNTKILRTDLNGNIVFTSDGNKISYKTDKKDNSQTVYVTETGTKYHLSGCRYLSNSSISISLSEARTKYSPCSVCKPPN
jgi:competence protein ComEC